MSPMSHRKHTGKTSYEETQFEWELTDYFVNKVTEFNVYLDSSTFNFGRSCWRLRLLRSSSCDSEFLFLQDMTTNMELEVEYEIGLKKVDDSVEQYFTGQVRYSLDPSSVQLARITRSEMLKRKHELAPRNGLTFMCILRRGRAQIQAPSTKFIKLDMLSENFKSLSENKDSCDMTLRVNEKEFHVHKAVLIARSPVFAAMFKHDTSEKRTGIVDVPDCDLDSFHEFLEYLYCGKLEDMSFRSAFYLYKTSDKYSVQDLMHFCVEYMKHCLTEDNLCDVVKLAELYSDTKLMAAAQAFFNKNVSKVVVTTAWESLMETNYRLANRLIIDMIQELKLWMNFSNEKPLI